MRTTVTLDRDVELLLREATHRSRSSFKKTINTAIRNGLQNKRAVPKRVRYVIKARPLGLRAGIDPTSLNKLADELETGAFLEKAGSSRRR